MKLNAHARMSRRKLKIMRIRFAFRSLLIAIAVLTLSVASFAQLEISVNIAPPELPVYEQPVCPGDGYIWTPGYWAWDGDDYYWVPGTWVMAPQPGYFWTPGYWGWGGNSYIFHQGYWGPQVGFYGGIYYGYGYFGHGYEGGRWDNGHFFYNRSVNNVNVTEIHNVYNTTVVNNYNRPRVSYNGGNGGINARPTSDDERDRPRKTSSASCCANSAHGCCAIESRFQGFSKSWEAASSCHSQTGRVQWSRRRTG